MKPATTLTADLDLALTALLAAIIDHDRARQNEPPDILVMDMSEPYDYVASSVEEWGRNPVRKALKEGVRKIGKLTHHIGGDELMEKMADRQYDEPHAPSRLTILSSAWDCIGSWAA